MLVLLTAMCHDRVCVLINVFYIEVQVWIMPGVSVIEDVIIVPLLSLPFAFSSFLIWDLLWKSK